MGLRADKNHCKVGGVGSRPASGNSVQQTEQDRADFRGKREDQEVSAELLTVRAQGCSWKWRKGPEGSEATAIPSLN